MSQTWCWSLVALLACAPSATLSTTATTAVATSGPTTGTAVDTDGDGFPEGEDCDDGDALVYPGAPDAWYDGVDSDCMGNDDFDADADGYAGDGGPDCADTEARVHPGAVEMRCDGFDNDCAGDGDDRTHCAVGLDEAISAIAQTDDPGMVIQFVGDLDGDGAADLSIEKFGAIELWVGLASTPKLYATVQFLDNGIALGTSGGIAAGDADGDGHGDYWVDVAYFGTDT